MANTKKKRTKKKTTRKKRGSGGGVRRLLSMVAVVIVLVAAGPPIVARALGLGADQDVLPMPAKPVVLDNGMALNVIDRGTGHPVVLVHGLPGSATDWVDLPDQLARAGYRGIAYDRVGYGYSSRADGSAGTYTLVSNAEDLRRLLDALGVKRAALVGWSYGGGVVQLFAEKYPERVSHLVLVGAVGPSYEPRQDAFRTVMHSPLGLPVLHWVGSIPPLSRTLMHDTLVRAFAVRRDVPEGWTEYSASMMALDGTARAFVSESKRMDVSVLKPHTLKTPTLVVHGNDDYLVPLSVAHGLDADLPNSKLVVIKGGSHMLPITHTERMTDVIHAHVGRG